MCHTLCSLYSRSRVGTGEEVQRPASTLKGPAGAEQGEEPVLGVEALDLAPKLLSAPCVAMPSLCLSVLCFQMRQLDQMISKVWPDSEISYYMILGGRQVYAFSGWTSWPFSRGDLGPSWALAVGREEWASSKTVSYCMCISFLVENVAYWHRYHSNWSVIWHRRLGKLSRSVI